jgi:biotin-(acetyl-CoA carboxylase) ligase
VRHNFSAAAFVREFFVDTQTGNDGYGSVSTFLWEDDEKIFTELYRILREKFPAYAVRLCGEVASTQDVAREALRDLRRAIIVLAECQTAGRGRHGRSWISSNRENVYLSIGFPFLGRNGDWMHCSERIGGKISSVFAKEFSIPLVVKAPNDLLLNGSKICGILLEVVGDDLILGIGMNLVRDENLQAHCAQPVTAIDDLRPLSKLQAVPTLCQCAICCVEEHAKIAAKNFRNPASDAQTPSGV